MDSALISKINRCLALLESRIKKLEDFVSAWKTIYSKQGDMTQSSEGEAGRAAELKGEDDG